MAAELSLDRILALDRTKKILILVGTLVVISILYFWLLFLPTHNEIQQLDRRLSGLLSKKAEQEAIAQNLEAFKREYHHLEESLQKAMAQLPNKKEIPSLLENISNLGRESGLEVSLFKPGAEEPKDFYAEVPVNIKLVGSYANLLTFLYRVGNLPRIVNISDLSVKKGKEKDAPFLLDSSCKATTYKFLEESERAARQREGTNGRERRGRGRRARRR